MLDITHNIRSLTDFKRKTAEFLNQMKETGHPVVLTVNGKAALVVQDADPTNGSSIACSGRKPSKAFARGWNLSSTDGPTQ